MSEKWYVVPDLDNFTDKARAIVYNNFGAWQNKDELDILIDDVKENDQEEFDKLLSHQESLVIIKTLVKKQKNRKTKEIRYTINDNIFADIVYKLNDRMVSNIVNSLVQKGLVESAFDSDANDFVFWIKDQHENEKEKPETD
jgi:DNA-binding HxlR family transcriptional regulator